MLMVDGSGKRNRGDGLVVRCVHCGVSVIDDVVDTTPSVWRLRDHILGCPAALAIFEPALPIFRDRAELLNQFVFAPTS